MSKLIVLVLFVFCPISSSAEFPTYTGSEDWPSGGFYGVEDVIGLYAFDLPNTMLFEKWRAIAVFTDSMEMTSWVLPNISDSVLFYRHVESFMNRLFWYQMDNGNDYFYVYCIIPGGREGGFNVDFCTTKEIDE